MVLCLAGFQRLHLFHCLRGKCTSCGAIMLQLVYVVLLLLLLLLTVQPAIVTINFLLHSLQYHCTTSLSHDL